MSTALSSGFPGGGTAGRLWSVVAAARFPGEGLREVAGPSSVALPTLKASLVRAEPGCENLAPTQMSNSRDGGSQLSPATQRDLLP